MTYIFKLNHRTPWTYIYADRTLTPGTDAMGSYFGQLIADRGKQIGIMKSLSASLKSCFGKDFFGTGDGHKFFDEVLASPEEDNIDYFFVFSPSSVRSANVSANTTALVLLFSFQVVRNEQNKTFDIYSVCKTNNPGAKNLRASEILNTVINAYFTSGIFTKAWLGVLFSNRNFISVVKSYLRAGFDIKYVSSIGTNEKTDLSIRTLVMEAYAGKRAFSPETPKPFNIDPAELDRLINIANNIKYVEYDNLNFTNYRLDPSGWRLFFLNTIIQQNECGGIVYTHTDDAGTKIIDNFSILMGCEGSSFGAERQCVTQQAYSHDINFHIHSLSCYNKIHEEHTLLASPSLVDYTTQLVQYNNKSKLFHMVVAIEGIYVIQVHPYWKFLMDEGHLTYGTECFTGLVALLEAYVNPMLFANDINDALKYGNNLLTPDLLMKNVGSNSEDIKRFKSSCIAQGLNRNINLFICSFVRYPRKAEILGVQVPMLQYITFMREVRLDLEQALVSRSPDEINKRINAYLSNEFFNDTPAEIPYFEYTPEYKAQLRRTLT